MSCPFYGASLTLSMGQLVRFPGHTSNRCALIASAHSPCWMEVDESRSPDWSECPRNPEVHAKYVLITEADPGGLSSNWYVTADLRFLQSVSALQRLMRIRGKPE